MVIATVFLIAGFVLLLKGADWLVDGASSIAKRHRVSDLSIGLTIVAFGTSLPELIVSVFAAVNGSPEIALGNVIGSNIVNTLLVLGVAAIITPLVFQKNTTLREVPLNVIATLTVAALLNDALWNPASSSALSRGDGALLMFLFVVFLWYIFTTGRMKQRVSNQDLYDRLPYVRSWLAIGFGAVALWVGGRWILENVILISQSLGIGEGVAGLTILAIGTSLPELITSVIAVRKRNMGIAVGNVMGSNMFNLLWILGLTAIIRPVPLNSMNVDLAVLLVITIALFGALFWWTRHTLERWQGWGFVGLYAGYVALTVLRSI